MSITDKFLNENNQKQERLNAYFTKEPPKDDRQPVPDGEYHVLLKSKDFREDKTKTDKEYWYLVSSWQILCGEYKDSVFNNRQNIFEWNKQDIQKLFETDIPIGFAEPLENRLFVGKIKVKKNEFKGYDILSMEPFRQVDSIDDFIPLDSIDDIGNETDV